MTAAANNQLQAADLGRVVLVIGGDSAEREISLRGGRDVARALQDRGVELNVIDGPRALLAAIGAGCVDRVFILLHGRGGEDGTLQGALEVLGIPYTGCGVLASALAIDKLQTKRLWRACGLPTPDWRVARRVDDGAAILEHLDVPVFVKPAREGSSVGMSRVDRPEDLAEAIEKALACDTDVLVERLVDGPEYTVGILDGEALPLIRIRVPQGFYDFDAKYESDSTGYDIPCGLDEASEQRLRSLSLQAFELLGGSGWGRVDLMLDNAGEPWLLEANTAPGMTDHSLLPKAAAAVGIDFEELVWRILKTSC